MANVYQQGYSYLIDTGTPETGSFVINNSTWTSATTISLHNIPFDSFDFESNTVSTRPSQLIMSTILYHIFLSRIKSINIRIYTDNN